MNTKAVLLDWQFCFLDLRQALSRLWLFHRRWTPWSDLGVSCVRISYGHLSGGSSLSSAL